MKLTRLKSYHDISVFYFKNYLTDEFLRYLYLACNISANRCHEDVNEFYDLLVFTSIFSNYLLYRYNLESGLLDYVDYFCKLNGFTKDELFSEFDNF